MSSIRFKSDASTISAEVIRELRKLTTLSISELRQLAEHREALLEFQIFRHPWDETKRSIRRMLELVESGRLPLSIFEFCEPSGGFPATEEQLTTIQLRQRLESWKRIANETQMLTELEDGYIQSPSEFAPDDD